MAPIIASYPQSLERKSPVIPTRGRKMGVTHLSPVSMVEMTERGRRRSCSVESSSQNFDRPRSGSPNDQTGASDEATRKRRRSRKGLDKRFECTEEGCGKTYSRAEHLHRHQLNHSSKLVFHCEYPDCSRTFVRADLLKRHMDRHAAKGYHLSRRDNAAQPSPHSGGSERSLSDPSKALPSHSNIQFSHASYSGGLPGDIHAAILNPTTVPSPNSTFECHDSPRRLCYNEFIQEGNYSHHSQAQPPMGMPQPPSLSVPAVNSSHGPPSPPSNHYRYRQQQTHLQPAGGFAKDIRHSCYHVRGQYLSASSFRTESSHSNENMEDSEAENHLTEAAISQTSTTKATGPIFGGSCSLIKSLHVGMPDDFLTYLFGDVSLDHQNSSHETWSSYSSYQDRNDNRFSYSYPESEAFTMGYFPPAPQKMMAVNNLLDQNEPEACMSDMKTEEIYGLIIERFRQHDDQSFERQRAAMLEGDRSDGNHVLSKRMMQSYIVSYWYHFSDQMPIIHKPTFCPERTPNLLLIAMMAIGAALLDRSHGQSVVNSSTKLSQVLAYKARWEILMHADAGPPAKLWVFQALILLEVYEKMYSSRESHERASIHHASMIHLMRRGRSVLGRTAMDVSSNSTGCPNGFRQTSSSSAPLADEEWWEQWVTNESTRRTAFAAFIIDSTHATMFGQPGVMVAHEVRLPLPCDESLWRATSAGQLGRIEATLRSDGVQPISFLEGLKRTLCRQPVQTNSLGRTVLMAGLLNVSWHMNQRDLEANALDGGVVNHKGERDRWRLTLANAYDSWKSDFDDYLDGNEPPTDPYRHNTAKKHEFNIVSESCSVLYHLAHMGMHADIIDIQILGHAKCLLGRTISSQDFNSAHLRIVKWWAPSSRARAATYYALRVLCLVLLRDMPEPSHNQVGSCSQIETYQTKDDLLLNRSWILYYATLVVWCYGYATQGPFTGCGVITPMTEEDRKLQMRDYLLTFGSATDPSGLTNAPGLNNSIALLMVVKDAFRETGWGLLQEASDILDNCISLTTGKGIQI